MHVLLLILFLSVSSFPAQALQLSSSFKSPAPFQPTSTLIIPDEVYSLSVKDLLSRLTQETLTNTNPIYPHTLYLLLLWHAIDDPYLLQHVYLALEAFYYRQNNIEEAKKAHDNALAIRPILKASSHHMDAPPRSSSFLNTEIKHIRQMQTYITFPKKKETFNPTHGLIVAQTLLNAAKTNTLAILQHSFYLLNPQFSLLLSPAVQLTKRALAILGNKKMPIKYDNIYNDAHEWKRKLDLLVMEYFLISIKKANYGLAFNGHFEALNMQKKQDPEAIILPINNKPSLFSHPDFETIQKKYPYITKKGIETALSILTQREPFKKVTALSIGNHGLHYTDAAYQCLAIHPFLLCYYPYSQAATLEIEMLRVNHPDWKPHELLAQAYVNFSDHYGKVGRTRFIKEMEALKKTGMIHDAVYISDQDKENIKDILKQNMYDPTFLDALISEKNKISYAFPINGIQGIMAGIQRVDGKIDASVKKKIDALCFLIGVVAQHA